jgi:predicted DNA-binding protein
MEIFTKKTTILFPPELYGRLANLAEQRHSSVGELVREACRVQYSLVSVKDRLSLVDRLAALQLPVGTQEEMERESVAPPVDLGE